jgi:hypothetical protein
VSLQSRLKKLEHLARQFEKPKVIVGEVPRFDPGPDAPWEETFIIVRDPQGRERRLRSLREYYTVTTLQPEDVQPCR